MSNLSGLDFYNNRSRTALEAILNLIEKAERIEIGMAFLNHGGWKLLRDALTTFVERGGRLRVVLRRDRWYTGIGAVSTLRKLPNTEVRFHRDPQFHPKHINFYRGNKLAVLVGSANITAGGLQTNPEDGVIVELDARSRAGRRARQTFEAWWRESTPVTENDLRELKAARRKP